MKSYLAAPLFLLCVTSACSDDTTTVTPQGTVSSCDLTVDLGYCMDFDASAPKSTAKGNCDNAKSTLGYNGVANESGSCPTANRVGTCLANIHGIPISYRYFAPKFTAAAAETNCKGLSGTGGTGGSFVAN